jgi:uncharacterized protein YecT (DUF1311 family)
MKRNWVLPAALWACLFLPAGLSLAEEGQIDAFEEQCAGKPPAAREDCRNLVLKMWGVEVNTAYKEYLSRLDPRGKNLLRDSQTAWIRFRKAEIARLQYIMAQNPGAFPKDLALDYLINLDRNRARVLQEFGKIPEAGTQ